MLGTGKNTINSNDGTNIIDRELIRMNRLKFLEKKIGQQPKPIQDHQPIDMESIDMEPIDMEPIIEPIIEPVV